MDITNKLDIIIADIGKDITHLQNLLNDPDIISSLINNPSVLADLKNSIQNLSHS